MNEEKRHVTRGREETSGISAVTIRESPLCLSLSHSPLSRLSVTIATVTCHSPPLSVTDRPTLSHRPRPGSLRLPLYCGTAERNNVTGTAPL
ncbi:hypothetical protein XELAEV_18000485mg [Xenopus laevis]|uniref:Uncharacterized protein n=1 Tax=Xenopus laevis TaxID=8355 RepID=A0A974GYI8_XENLA|nr:hypothetical protein XELAEV_18000485mg [Xenopus laevis]